MVHRSGDASTQPESTVSGLTARVAGRAGDVALVAALRTARWCGRERAVRDKRRCDEASSAGLTVSPEDPGEAGDDEHWAERDEYPCPYDSRPRVAPPL